MQKSQIKQDRSKEVVPFSLKEQLINYWPHNWISQDFFPPWEGRFFDSLAMYLDLSAAEPVLWNVTFLNKVIMP